MSRSRFILQQSKMQARLFALLATRRIDAKEFIRAFMNSKVAEGLDAPYDRMQWAGEEYIYRAVVEEAGLKASPVRRRYSRDSLFYAGYIYRYWHYLTGESSRAIYRQADENQILASYGYHTESNELAIEDLKQAAADWISPTNATHRFFKVKAQMK